MRRRPRGRHHQAEREPKQVSPRAGSLFLSLSLVVFAVAMGGGDAARPAVPRPPSARSLLVLQNQLASGLWAERHVAALGEDVANARTIVSILECTRDAHNFLASKPSRQWQAQTRCAPPRHAPPSPPSPPSLPSLLFSVQRARWHCSPILFTPILRSCVAQEPRLRVQRRVPRRDCCLGELLPRGGEEAA